MWRKIEIKDYHNDLTVETRIQESFYASYMMACAAEGFEVIAKAAMYTKRIRNDLFFYFTPETNKIFDGSTWGIQPCERPQGVKLHVGDAGHNPVEL